MGLLLPALKQEVARVTALAFLHCWHLGIKVYFMESVWWNFLDPRLLAVDLSVVAILFMVNIIAPLLLEVPVVSRINMKFWWIGMGIIPGVLVPLTAVPHTYLRFFLLAVCFFCSYASDAGAFEAPAGSFLSRSWPWVSSLGILLLQGLKFGWGSVNPLMNMHYTDPEHAYLGFKLVGSAIAVACSVYVRHCETDVPPDTPTQSPVEEGSATGVTPDTIEGHGCCKDRRDWLWLALGPVLACYLTLTMTFMSNPGAMMKFAGVHPFPAGLIVPLCIAIGMPLAYILAKRGAALPLFVFVSLLVGVSLLAGDAACNGPENCSGSVSFVGAIFFSLAWPSLSTIISIHASFIASGPVDRGCCSQGCCRSKGHAGRLFGFSGFFVFLHLILYIAACTYSTVPSMGGRVGGWLWLVVAPCLAGVFVIFLLHLKQNGFTASSAALALDEPYKDLAFAGITPRAVACVVFACFVVVLIPAISYRAARANVTSAPRNASAFTVMAFNNMQGYDTDGNWNGECFVDVIRSESPDIVSIPEGESMHLFTGNRDPIDFAATSLQMYVDFGPPSWVGGVGVAALSVREIHESTWHAMPKEAANLNRFLVRSVVSFGGVKVSVLSIHAEWFGDPSMQTQFIANFAANIEGPVVVAGDFNLEPNGANRNAPNATGLQALVDVGLRSVTPLTCSGSAPEWHLCRSSVPNTVVDEGCLGLESCDGYQLDYIFYTPNWLRLVPGSVKVVEVRIGDKEAWCSDHQPILATFELTSEASQLPRFP